MYSLISSFRIVTWLLLEIGRVFCFKSRMDDHTWRSLGMDVTNHGYCEWMLHPPRNCSVWLHDWFAVLFCTGLFLLSFILCRFCGWVFNLDAALLWKVPLPYTWDACHCSSWSKKTFWKSTTPCVTQLCLVFCRAGLTWIMVATSIKKDAAAASMNYDTSCLLLERSSHCFHINASFATAV